MYKMIRKIEYIKVKNDFQDHLKQDLETIKSSKNVLVFVDKSTNLYELPKENYEKLLHDSIPQTYKKATVNAEQMIDKEQNKFAKNLSFEGRMECYSDNHAYITLKDHKEIFRNNIKCRLINPSKNEVGISSKCYLSNVIADVSKTHKLTNGGTHRRSLIGLKTMQIIFYIAEFYLSISKDLLKKSINYAKSFTTIEENGFSVINLARKSVLFIKDRTWVKKSGNELFDVTMGRFDGAETCKLVSLYLLNKLSKLLGNDNVRLYRDDGLAEIKNISGPALSKTRKTSSLFLRKMVLQSQ